VSENNPDEPAPERQNADTTALHEEYGDKMEFANNGQGRGLRYKAPDGAECDIKAFMLKDGGVYFEFVRDGRAYPLRLSRMGIEAMVSLWHELSWGSWQ
jgi:hypothetical protein